ncbi:MAG: hypothetical protein Q8M88_01040 [Phenylobacterium sp.]|uniref:hypothetical protein n=1 Tax=Phenylobacterium sp. TaxID=1871053 RepID=UPI00273708A1|nr:hypothetical protein [Phenylobacterium sp.]MDP3173003.1 hypothetical protein [Phenylobacterium sp.]
MGMSLELANARAFEEAEERLKQYGALAPDLCIEEYIALGVESPRRQELTKVIAALSMM